MGLIDGYEVYSLLTDEVLDQTPSGLGQCVVAEGRIGGSHRGAQGLVQHSFVLHDVLLEKSFMSLPSIYLLLWLQHTSGEIAVSCRFRLIFCIFIGFS